MLGVFLFSKQLQDMSASPGAEARSSSMSENFASCCDLEPFLLSFAYSVSSWKTVPQSNNETFWAHREG